MFTYVILNFLVLGGLLLLTKPWRSRRAYSKMIPVFIVLFVLTAIFDSIIIANKIVSYDHATLLGIYIFKAPIEDFGYIIGTVLLVPYLWRLYEHKD